MKSRFNNLLNFTAENTSNYIEINGTSGFLSPNRGVAYELDSSILMFEDKTAMETLTQIVQNLYLRPKI